MSNMSKNEQIAAMIVVFVILCVAGWFTLVAPAYADIAVNKAERDARVAEFNDKKERFSLAAFKTVEANILAAYENGKDAAENFYNHEFKHYEADRKLREILRGAGLNTTNLTIETLNTAQFDLNLFSPQSISYRIKELAQIGGGDDDVPAPAVPVEEAGEEGEDGEKTMPVTSVDGGALVERLKNAASKDDALRNFYDNISVKDKAKYAVAGMRHFLAAQEETVGWQSFRFNIVLTHEQRVDLSMHLYQLDDASFMQSLLYANVEGEYFFDGDGNLREASAGGEHRNFTLDISLFIVEPMEKPNFDYESKFSWEIDNKG